MNRFLRCVCLVLAIALMLPTTALAAEQESSASTYSAYFVTYDSYLWKTSSTGFEVWFDVCARDIMLELGASSIIVQRSYDGTTWTSMREYTPDKYPQMLCENTGSHGDCVLYYNGLPGYYYRAYVTFYAKKSSGYGKVFLYTQPMQL